MKKMKKKGMAKGGALPMKTDPKTGAKVPAYAMDGKGKMKDGGKVKKKGMAKGGAMKKKGYAMGGVTSYGTPNPEPMGMQQPQMPKKPAMAKGGSMMKKKGYASGGVMSYNLGGMVKSSGTLNTGIKKAKPVAY